MPIWLWIVVGVFIVLTAVAVVIRALKPREFEPLEMEFDMRALKQVKVESEQERKIAKTRELAKRQYSTHQTKRPDD